MTVLEVAFLWLAVEEELFFSEWSDAFTRHSPTSVLFYY
jgi:hypothetical protein